VCVCVCVCVCANTELLYTYILANALLLTLPSWRDEIEIIEINEIWIYAAGFLKLQAQWRRGVIWAWASSLFMSENKFQRGCLLKRELCQFFLFFLEWPSVALDYWKSVWWHTEHHWARRAPPVNLDLRSHTCECETPSPQQPLSVKKPSLGVRE